MKCDVIEGCGNDARVYCQCYVVSCNEHITAHNCKEGNHEFIKIDNTFLANKEKKSIIDQIKKIDEEKLEETKKIENLISENKALTKTKIDEVDKAIQENIDKIMSKNIEASKAPSSYEKLKGLADEHQKIPDELLEKIDSFDTVEKGKKVLMDKFGLIAENHNSSVKSLAITSDDKYLVSASYDSTIRLWNLKEKRQEYIFRGHSNDIYSVSISNDDIYVLSTSADSTIRIWNIQEKIQVGVLTGSKEYFYCGIFSADRKNIISGDNNNIVSVWDTKTKEKQFDLMGHTSHVMVLALEGKFLYSGDWRGNIFVWDLTERTQTKAVKAHDGALVSLHICNLENRKTIITSGKDKSIVEWDMDLERGENITEKSSNGRIVSLDATAVSKTSKLIASGLKNDVRVWGYDEIPYDIKDNQSSINSIVITNDNEFVIVGCEDSTIKIIDVKKNIDAKKSSIEHVFDGHTEFIKNIAITKDQKYAFTSGWDSTIRVWDLISRYQVKVYSSKSEAEEWRGKYIEMSKILDDFNS